VTLFMNIAEAITHFGGLGGKVTGAGRHSLDRACRVIRDEARASLGHYQEAAGPFEAWAPLAEATMEDRARQGYPADEPELRDGTLRDSIEYRVDSPHQAEVGSNDPVAVYQEHGTAKMPPRSILGGAAVRSIPKVLHIVGSDAVMVLRGKSHADVPVHD
jgi:HK97 gp10 family phage protein